MTAGDQPGHGWTTVLRRQASPHPHQVKISQPCSPTPSRDQVHLKVEFEIEDDGTELEIELTW